MTMRAACRKNALHSRRRNLRPIAMNHLMIGCNVSCVNRLPTQLVCSSPIAVCLCLLPSAARFQGSFARSPAWFNIDGMCRGASQQWSLDDFAARFLSAAQQGARDVGCVWREVERQEKRFSRSDNHFELTITLQCCTLSTRVVIDRR